MCLPGASDDQKRLSMWRVKELGRIVAELFELVNERAPGSLPTVDRHLVNSEPVEVIRDCLVVLAARPGMLHESLLRRIEDVVIPDLSEDDDPEDFTDALRALDPAA